MNRTLLLLYKLMTMVGLFWSMSAFPGEIALTFDDVPLPGGNVMSGKEKTQRIIQQLKNRGVNEALFYVTGKNVDEESSDRLSDYVNAGFYLANHSYAHKSANKVSVDDILVDAYRTHLTL
ncbi:polysaccharide deacetylase family protein [Microbulbifer rhizosphaerae]|uniref:Peptidoglycan/xylan/chitin deacetylase (PgdA/CDA1 family) n=1 Tax=Microbulbifer rhizosphaerae TaxID=1562603 RepID=A0A7W4W8G6_9GAMM|nr:polysaccharide deacetylase family protein [Microbulbifer rhizosphaerae]MBB3059569.1 peptidoglycan/xylan/chitin deacetylase (PgdA/CDA1 family) [Microbulbifer rhizosphaerae]